MFVANWPISPGHVTDVVHQRVGSVELAAWSPPTPGTGSWLCVQPFCPLPEKMQGLTPVFWSWLGAAKIEIVAAAARLGMASSAGEE